MSFKITDHTLRSNLQAEVYTREKGRRKLLAHTGDPVILPPDKKFELDIYGLRNISVPDLVKYGAYFHYINLIETKTNPDGLRQLSTLENILYLHLINPLESDMLEPLEHWRALRLLHVDVQMNRQSSLKDLRLLTQLRELYVHGYENDLTDAGMELISGGQNITELLLNDYSAVTIAGWQQLHKMKRLKKLILWGSSLDNAVLGYLKGLEAKLGFKLRYCDTTQHYRRKSMAEKASDFASSQPEKFLSKPASYREKVIKYYFSDLRKPAFDVIFACPNIRELVFRDLKFSGDELSCISELTQLKSLTFHYCCINDEQLRFLDQLNGLTSLTIRFSRYTTDKTIERISRLRKLRHLDLKCFTGLTDEGLALLGNLKNLHTLILRGCSHTTETAASNLQKKLKVNDFEWHQYISHGEFPRYRPEWEK